MTRRTSAGRVRHLACTQSRSAWRWRSPWARTARLSAANRARATAGRAPAAGGTRTGELLAERSGAERSGAEGRDRHARAPGSRQLRAELRPGRPLDRRARSLHARQGVRHARVHHQGAPRSDRGAGLLHAQAPSRHGDLRRDGVEPHDRHQGQPVGDHPHGRNQGRVGPHRVDAELGLGEQHPQAAAPAARLRGGGPMQRAAVLDQLSEAVSRAAASCCRKSKRHCRSSPRRRRATATAT